MPLLSSSARRLLAALLSALLALGLLAGFTGLAGPASAVEGDDGSGSAVTITLPAYGEGASLTFSQTQGLTDGQTIHVTGKYRYSGANPLRLAEVVGEYLPFDLQVITGIVPTPATETADKVLDLGVRDVALGDGWWSVDQEFTITRVLDEPDTGTSYDGAQFQLYLALGTSGSWSPPAGDHVYQSLGFPGDTGTPVTPITFAGGAATLTTYHPVAITTQPTAVTVAEGGTATFTVAATGTPAPAFQWQQDSGDGQGFTDIAGATAATLTTTALAIDDGVRYRVRVGNRLGYVESAPVALSVTTSDDPDGVTYPLYFPGSYVKLSTTTGLHDGDTITVDDFVQSFPDDMTSVTGTYVAQSLSNQNDPFALLTESRMGVLPWTEASSVAARRNFGHGTYVVHETLTRDGTTVDCKVTQCYLAVFGDVADADGDYVNADDRPDADQAAASVYHLQATDIFGYSQGTEVYATRYVPLYFAGGTLTPPAWVKPSFTAQPADATVTNGYGATFTASVTGTATIQYQWQSSADGGESWTSIRNAVSSSYQVAGSGANNGWQFRLRARNNGGTTYSRAVTLTVQDATGNYDDPNADVSAHGISLDWLGDKVLQDRSPAYSPNYLSAGVSEGAQATYKNAEGDVVVGYRDNATGAESVATYAQRGRSNAGAGKQFVRLTHGTVHPTDGGGDITWDGTFSINFYGGLVPFTLSDPELSWDADGRGTLKADLAGFGSSQENPNVKVPLAPAADQTVATFSHVRLSSAGVLTATPDYHGVAVDTGGATPQATEGSTWGSWPQQWVDFQVKTGLDSYWYSSGSDKDADKVPYSLSVSGLKGSGVTAPANVPTVTVTPPSSATYGTAATVEVSVPDATGQVALTGAGTDLSATLTAGKATFTLPRRLAAGDHVLTATYAGDDTYDGATGSATLSVAQATPTVTVQAPASVSAGTKAEVTVTVPDATGEVTLTGAGAAQSATLTDGTASFTLPDTLPLGTHTLSVAYAGDDNVRAGTGTGRVAVVPRSSTTRLSLSVARPPYGKAVTGAVTVAGATTGTVTLAVSGAGAPRRLTLSDGRAIFALPATLAVGSHRITATYAGAGTVGGSSTTSAVVVVKAGVRIARITVTKKPTHATKGRARLVLSSSTGMPVGGKVVLKLRKGKHARKVTTTVRNGVATVKLPKLAKGRWKVTVDYRGTATLAAASASATVKVRR